MGNAGAAEPGPDRDIGSPGLVGPSMPPARATPRAGPDGQQRPEAFGALFNTTRDDIARIEGLPTAAPKNIPTGTPSKGSATASNRSPAPQQKPVPALSTLGKGLQQAQASQPTGAESELQSEAGDWAAAPASASHVGVLEVTKTAYPLAKRKVKKNTLLHAWEDPPDSDEEAEERRRDEEREAGKGHIKFEPDEEKLAKHAKGEAIVLCPEAEALPSWEEKVLNLAVDTRIPETNTERTRGTATGSSYWKGSSVMTDGDHIEDSLVPSRHTEGRNDEELRKLAQEEAGCQPVGFNHGWSPLTNQPTKWTGGNDDGVLDGSDSKRLWEVVTLIDGNFTHSDFDMQAEIMIDQEGDPTNAKAGLIFRCDNNGNFFAFYVAYAGGIWTATLTQYYRRHGQGDFKTEKHYPLQGEHQVDIMPRQWHFLRVRAVGKQVLLFLDGEQLGLGVNLGVKAIEVQKMMGRSRTTSGNAKGKACLGLYTGRNRLKIRSMLVTNLQEYTEALGRCYADLEEEKKRLRTFHVHRLAQTCRMSRASRLIQEVAKFKVELINQRMKRYYQSEEQRNAGPIRERNLLTWIAVLHFAAKFDDVLHEGNELQIVQQQYLKRLDAPPLPPPPENPPNEAEEELHMRYEKARYTYRKKWEDAGKQWMGKEQFDKMREMKDEEDAREGKTTAMEKRIDIANILKQKADNVMSEQEHQDNLRRAWILSNDWQTIEEYEQEQAEEAAARKKREAARA